MRKNLIRPMLPLAAALLLGACGSGDSTDEAPPATTSPYPYTPGETAVIGQGGAPQIYGTPAGDGCIRLEKNDCVKPQKTCGDGAYAEVIVNSKGEVIDIVCYPVKDVPVTPIAPAGQQEGKFDNKEVIVLDAADDGEDIKGDVNIDGNNVTLYGQGPALSVIGGNLTVTKNNAIVHGVRIKGNAVINGNDVAFTGCVIDGDLTINGNNNTIAGCEVWGKLIDAGQNDALVANLVQGGITQSGSNLVCADNKAFSDPDKNGLVAPGEIGAPIECGGKDGKK